MGGIYLAYHTRHYRVSIIIDDHTIINWIKTGILSFFSGHGELQRTTWNQIRPVESRPEENRNVIVGEGLLNLIGGICKMLICWMIISVQVIYQVGNDELVSSWSSDNLGTQETLTGNVETRHTIREISR